MQMPILKSMEQCGLWRLLHKTTIFAGQSADICAGYGSYLCKFEVFPRAPIDQRESGYDASSNNWLGSHLFELKMSCIQHWYFACFQLIAPKFNEGQLRQWQVLPRRQYTSGLCVAKHLISLAKAVKPVIIRLELGLCPASEIAQMRYYQPRLSEILDSLRFKVQ